MRFGWGGIFLSFFFFERTRPASSMRPLFASFTSLLVMTQTRGSEATEAIFSFRAKKPLHTGVRTGCHYLISLCVESCTRPISTNAGSMEAGEYGLARGTCFVALCLEVFAVAGLMWISWCVVDGAGFFRVFHEFAFLNS